jgi:hypothetical protein
VLARGELRPIWVNVLSGSPFHRIRAEALHPVSHQAAGFIEDFVNRAPLSMESCPLNRSSL